MPEKFLNKYRIPSARLQDWDYKSAAPYFISICTHNREHHFGEIRNGEMQLSVIGKIVEAEWIRTPAIRPDMNLELGEFVVMPNHFHAILIIGENEFNTRAPRLHGNADGDHRQIPSNSVDHINAGIINYSMGNIETGDMRTLEIIDECRDVGRDAMHCVSTAERVPQPLTTTYATKNKFAPQSKNLASIIRGFKSSVTTKVKKMQGMNAGLMRCHSHGNRDFTITLYATRNHLNTFKIILPTTH